jgi:hypothetical protein
MGVGFEAVNRPGSKPTYFSRVQLMELILTWFGVPTGIAEEPQGPSPKPQAIATIVRGVLYLPGLGTRSELPERNSVMSRASLLDASGRSVMPLRAGANDLSRLPAGVYFARTNETNRTDGTYRVLLVR